MPTMILSRFIIVNIELKPLFSSPIRKPFALSKLSTQVGDPFIPILLSIDKVLTPFLVPTDPSSLTLNFGTKNKLIPLVPAGPPGILASTR